jgi:ATP-binding cassette, subfamily B, bacterial PglK
LTKRKYPDTDMNNLRRAYYLVCPEYRRYIAYVFSLMLVVALLESIAIGLFLPFIAILNSTDLVFENKYLNRVYLGLGFLSVHRFIVWLCVCLISLFLVKNIIYTVQSYLQSLFLVRIQSDIERRLMARYLAQDYLFFTQKNPAELAQNIRCVSGIVGLVFVPALTAMTEVVILICVFVMLVLIQPLLMLGLVGFSTCMMYCAYRYTRMKAAKYGEAGTRNLVDLNKWMYQAFGGIKELKILSKESFFLDQSMLYSRKAAWEGMKASMLSTLTRPFIETVWFSLIILIVLFALLAGSSGASVLPIMALLAAAAMRVMPALNRILNATISIRQGTYYLDTVATGLRSLNLPHDATLPEKNRLFRKEIRFENIEFSYPENASAGLHKVSFTIHKGQSVAFVGPSGAGKTTAVDLLLGLLDPQSGELLVDGEALTNKDTRGWRHNFGYVPQSIYLSDDTIRNNIAFGQLQTEIDSKRMDAVVTQAQLSDVLARLPQGLDTVVGDRGARLSGGQRQRIGIARALYRDPPILVLDEATSALDNETERDITQAIRDLSGSKTIILIAHRLSTVAHCDQIIFLADGAVRASGTYEALMRDCDDFRRFATATTT